MGICTTSTLQGLKKGDSTSASTPLVSLVPGSVDPQDAGLWGSDAPGVPMAQGNLCGDGGSSPEELSVSQQSFSSPSFPPLLKGLG